MKSLIIDCSAGMSVYVINGESVVYKIDNSQKKHTDELLLCVDELLSKCEINISAIDNLCVCVGPGSFTGIRVAISIAKGLAVDSKMKVFIASNFDIYELGLEENKCLVLEGFSKFVYVKRFSKSKITEECIGVDEFTQSVKNKKINIYVQNEKLQNLLKMGEISSIIAKNNIISYFKNKIQSNEFTNINQIMPVYLRASQAEMERNAKLSGVK